MTFPALVHPGHVHETVGGLLVHQSWWLLVPIGIAAAAWSAWRLVRAVDKH